MQLAAACLTEDLTPPTSIFKEEGCPSYPILEPIWSLLWMSLIVHLLLSTEPRRSRILWEENRRTRNTEILANWSTSSQVLPRKSTTDLDRWISCTRKFTKEQAPVNSSITTKTMGSIHTKVLIIHLMTTKEWLPNRRTRWSRRLVIIMEWERSQGRRKRLGKERR